MKASDYLLVKTVTYFAVYPDGRHCKVTRESVEKYGDAWATENPPVRIVTHVDVTNVPVYGDIVLVDS